MSLSQHDEAPQKGMGPIPKSSAPTETEWTMANTRRNRKLRRRQRAGIKIRHRLIGGRTGSVRHKQRSGMLHERRRKQGVERAIARAS